MYDVKKELLPVCLLAILSGTLLHFFHDWLPSPFTALIAPVNESLWEHVKIIYWPYLLAAVFLTRHRPGAVRLLLLILPLLCAVMLAAGWLLHLVLHIDAVWVDVLLYIFLMVLGFWLPTRFSGPFDGVLWEIPVIISAVLGLMTVFFTLFPPDHLLFTDLSQSSVLFRKNF